MAIVSSPNGVSVSQAMRLRAPVTLLEKALVSSFSIRDWLQNLLSDVASSCLFRCCCASHRTRVARASGSGNYCQRVAMQIMTRGLSRTETGADDGK